MAKYLKQDSEEGFVEDSAMIEYLKFNNLRHTILGCMLGDFDENGHYVVSPRIESELISMRKYVVETLDNIDICQSAIKFDKQISFMVVFEMDCASLVLIEKLSFNANNKLNSGKYSNIVETVLDTVETSGVIDKNIIYKRWNIEPDVGEVLDVFDMDDDTLARYFGLVNRFKYLMIANKILLEKEHDLEEIESNFALNMLEIVSHYPKLKELVDKDVKTELDEQQEFLKADKPNFAKTLNEIVMQSIENNLSVLDEKEADEFMVEQHNAQNDYNIRVGLVVEMQREPAEIEDERLVEGVDITKLDVGSEARLETITTREAAEDMLEESKAVTAHIQEEIVDILTNKADEQKSAEQEKPAVEAGAENKNARGRTATKKDAELKAGADARKELDSNPRGATGTGEQRHGAKKAELLDRLKDMYNVDPIKKVGEETKAKVNAVNNGHEDSHETQEGKVEKKGLIGAAGVAGATNIKKAEKPQVKVAAAKAKGDGKKAEKKDKPKVVQSKGGPAKTGAKPGAINKGKSTRLFSDYYYPTDFTQGDFDSSTKATHESPATAPHGEKPVNNAPLDEKPKTPTKNAGDMSLDISQMQEIKNLVQQMQLMRDETKNTHNLNEAVSNVEETKNMSDELGDVKTEGEVSQIREDEIKAELDASLYGESAQEEDIYGLK